MAVCAGCGQENPAGFRFCPACGAALVGESAPGAPNEPDPVSFGGRYRVARFLGEGGKKRVYLAHDELLDRDVAFALIKAEGRTRRRRSASSARRRQWAAWVRTRTS